MLKAVFMENLLITTTGACILRFRLRWPFKTRSDMGFFVIKEPE